MLSILFLAYIPTFVGTVIYGGPGVASSILNYCACCLLYFMDFITNRSSTFLLSATEYTNIFLLSICNFK